MAALPMIGLAASPTQKERIVYCFNIVHARRPPMSLESGGWWSSLLSPTPVPSCSHFLEHSGNRNPDPSAGDHRMGSADCRHSTAVTTRANFAAVSYSSLPRPLGRKNRNAFPNRKIENETPSLPVVSATLVAQTLGGSRSRTATNGDVVRPPPPPPPPPPLFPLSLR